MSTGEKLVLVLLAVLVLGGIVVLVVGFLESLRVLL